MDEEPSLEFIKGVEVEKAYDYNQIIQGYSKLY
jgi:hypothetical protein